MHKFVKAGALGVAALGLVGVGAGATFTDSVHAQQVIKTGTLDLGISDDGATFASSVSDSYADEASDMSETLTVTVKNLGSLTAKHVKVKLAAAGSQALQDQLHVYYGSQDLGSISQVEGLVNDVDSGALASGASRAATFTIKPVTGQSLDDSAQGKSVALTWTVTGSDA